MKGMKTWFVFLTLLSGLFFASPLTYGEEPLKVGGLFALSGPAAHIGTSQRNSCLFVFDKVNQQGGIQGRKIDFVQADTEGDPTKALIATKKLVENDRVSCIVGPVRTDEGMAIKPYIDKAGVPTFMHCGSDVIITKPPVHWVFKSPYKTSSALGKIFAYCKERGWKRIAFLSSSDGFGKDGADHAKSMAPQYGLELVTLEEFNVTDVDMTAQLVRIKAKEVHAIVCWTIGPPGGIVAKNRKQLDIRAPLFQCHGQADPIFIKVAGEAGEDVMMPATKIYVGDELDESDVQKKKILKFVEEYTPLFGPPGVMVSYGADAAYIVVEALKQGGDRRERIREAIENTRGFVGLSGIYNMSPTDHNGLDIKDVVLVRVKNGRFRLVK